MRHVRPFGAQRLSRNLPVARGSSTFQNSLAEHRPYSSLPLNTKFPFLVLPRTPHLDATEWVSDLIPWPGQRDDRARTWRQSRGYKRETSVLDMVTF